MSQIVWTVLPNGIQAGGTYQASVLVSPRLSGTTLAGTPFANWPTTLAGLVFRLTFDPSGVSIPVTAVAQYDANLWTTIFGSAAVTPFAFKDNSQRVVWSYPVARTKSFIDGVYASVQATSATAYSSVDASQNSTLTKALGAVNVANDARVKFDLYAQVRKAPPSPSQIPAWRNAAKLEKQSITGYSADQQALYLAKRFYARPAATTSKDDHGNRIAQPRPTTPSFDFHQKLALLADHPYLMRRLGLVLDFQFQLAAVGVPANGFVRFGVSDQVGNPMSDAVTPRTAYEIAGTSYFRGAATAADVEIRDGFVPLDDTASFFTSQGETDGDAQKFVGFATNIQRLTLALTSEAPNQQPTAPPPQTVPARRTTGFFVARSGRGDATATRLTANAGLNGSITSATPNDLYGVDLLRGYRVDVKTAASAWFSLQRRRVSYSYGLTNPTPIADVADEAYIKASSGTSDPDPNGPDDLYLHEVMFGWEGWSLAVARPGRRLMPVYATPGDAIAPPSNPPNPDFPLNAKARVEPQSLLALRFGTAYSLRVRAVDLAGNSVAYTEPDASTFGHASPLQTYKRYEPIPPPTVVLRFAVTEGESVENLVIRSGEGMDPGAYAQHLNATYADPAFALKIYRATCERHVAPPKTTQAMAEAHGDFDGAFATSADTKAFFRLGTREEGTFSDKRIPSLTTDDGYIDGNPNQAAIVTPPQVPRDQRRAADGGPGTSSLTANRGDPLAPGEYVVCSATDATLPYLPDSAAGGAAFYDPAQGALLLSGAWQGTWPDWQTFRLVLTGGPAVMGGTVAGRVGTIALPPATILTLEYASTPAGSRLGHMAYVLDYGVSAAALGEGRHWMLTPRRAITFVHAVPQPLAAPVASMQVSRGNDETFVTHFGTLTSHSRSTNHVDMEATWQETLDVPSKPLPDDGVSSPTIAQASHAYQVPVVYGTDASPIERLSHELHDTKHRIVTYTPIAHTRFKEYFPAALVADAAKITLAGTAPGPRVDQTFSIPSASRPPVPKIVYVVPTFKWESSGGKSVRRGGGLRVYLERPWYATGEGELLGVLLYALGSPVDQISKWGRDPVFADGVAAPLAATDFKNAKTVATGIVLPGSAGPIDVAGFGVEFNADRRLWFCDIEIDPGSAYFPFVSLALARFQPESLPTLEISPMVRADFAQLAADRVLEFSTFASQVHVEVSGVVSRHAAESLLPPAPLPSSGAVGTQAVPSSRRVVAYVQERAAGSVGEMGWSALGGETSFAGSMPNGSNAARWVGDVGLPPPSSPPGERRVIVEEREYFAADPGDGTRLGGEGGGPDVGFRVVYLDAIPIPN